MAKVEYDSSLPFDEQPEELQAKFVTTWRLGFAGCVDFLQELQKKYPDKKIDPKSLFVLWMREGRNQKPW